MFITRRILVRTYNKSLSSRIRGCLLFFVLCLNAASQAVAEPWLDARDAGLRIDIERLSNAGIIKVPINTWPLMWASILGELETGDTKALPEKFKNSYARVLEAGKKATRINKPDQSVRLSAASDSQLLRNFGDKAREEAEITLRRKGITNNFAYNFEVTISQNPWDGDESHYDNSYFGVVMGNWVGLIGSIDRWWGPSQSSSLILSNNARPTPGITLQRNYSEAFEMPILKWLGPWTTSIFMTKLDDERFIDNAKLVGMHIGFRPSQALEINLRRTAQWGGEGRPENFSNFFDLLTGLADNCDNPTCKETEPGNQLGGVDMRWDLPWLDASIYGQTIGEDEAGGIPVRRAHQIGAQMSFTKQWFEGVLFLELDETSLKSTDKTYNVLYNHGIYRTGYRYKGRPIGATWDNDSSIISLGAIGYLGNGDKVEVRYSFGDINLDSLTRRSSLHTINTKGASFNTTKAKWQREYLWGELEIEGRYTDQIIDEFGRQEDKLRVAASINYYF
jgi:hypothetical protein